MSLRQFWVRSALPDDSPLHDASVPRRSGPRSRSKSRDVDDALDMMRPKER
jgi:hypothetical protein